MTIAPSVQTFIMAGGRGERLHPLTASRPKPAVPFGEIFRIVDFTLTNCLNSRLDHVSLLTQYRHAELQSYIQQSWSGLWSEMTRQHLVCLPPSGGNRYRGTADAVSQNIAALRRDGPEFVLVLSADQVYHMDYRELLRYHAETNADLTIASVEHSLTAAQHFGVVEIDGERRVIGFQEKPTNPRSVPSRPDRALINMGVYAFKREVLMQALRESCDENRHDFGRHVIPSLIGFADIRAYDFRDRVKDSPCYWRDIGTLDSYYESSMDIVRPDRLFDPYGNDAWPSYRPRYEVAPHVRARLRTNCRVTGSIVSPGVRIEDGACIESSVLLPRVWVGKDARIRHAIIEEGVHIPASFQIGFNSEEDRKHYFVTEAGVVVVSQTPKHKRPVVIYAAAPIKPRPGVRSRAA